MRIGFRATIAALAISAAMMGATVVPTFAQTTTTETPAKPKPVRHKRHVFHKGIPSADARNVGPSSSATGAAPVGGGAGNPVVPGAPAAGPANGGGGK